jgi:hypothetical protein
MTEREYLTCAEADELRLSASRFDDSAPALWMFHSPLVSEPTGQRRTSWSRLPDGRTLEERVDADGCRHWIEAP